MSTKLCERCKRRIKAESISCVCGWTASPVRAFLREIPKPLPSWQESKSAYDRMRGQISASLKPRTWTKGDFVEHYRKILANPDASAYAKDHSEQALRAFGIVRHDPERAAVDVELEAMREKMAPFREPGSDDEMPLGIGLDDLEREFGERSNP